MQTYLFSPCLSGAIHSALAFWFNLLGPQSRFGDNALNFQVVRPPNGTGVLTGLTAVVILKKTTDCRTIM